MKKYTRTYISYTCVLTTSHIQSYCLKVKEMDDEESDAVVRAGSVQYMS